MQTGQIIRQAREKRRYRLKELAEKSGVSITFLSDIENGRRNPSVETAKKIANVLNVDLKLLLNEEVADLINDITKDVKSITNPDIRAIARAGEKMSEEDAIELRNFAERLFPDAFKNEKKDS